MRVKNSLDDTLLHNARHLRTYEFSRRDHDLEGFDHRQHPYYLEQRRRILDKMPHHESIARELPLEVRLNRIDEKLRKLEETAYFAESSLEFHLFQPRNTALRPPDLFDRHLDRFEEPMRERSASPGAASADRVSLGSSLSNRYDLKLPQNDLRVRLSLIEDHNERAVSQLASEQKRPPLLPNIAIQRSSEDTQSKTQEIAARSHSDYYQQQLLAAQPRPPPPDPYEIYYRKPVGNIVGKRVERIQRRLKLMMETQKSKTHVLFKHGYEYKKTVLPQGAIYKTHKSAHFEGLVYH